MTERVLTTTVHDTREEELEVTLRPATLADFIGQERVKEQLAIALDAAKGRGEALDHVLLVGPPGPFMAAAFRPDSRTIVAKSDDERIRAQPFCVATLGSSAGVCC
jgi:hypothetical protein